MSDNPYSRFFAPQADDNPYRRLLGGGAAGGEDDRFRAWYAAQAKRWGLDPNPDDPEHRYDYRAAFAAGLGPDPKTGHWPSEFKADDHPNRYVGLIDTKTGRPAPAFAGGKPAFEPEPTERTPHPLNVLDPESGIRRAATGMRLGMVEGADFLLNLPETVARGATAPVFALDKLRERMDQREAEELASGAPVRPAAVMPPPEGLSAYGLPEIVDETFEDAREQQARLQEETLERATRAGASPVAAALASEGPRAVGNLLDPTMLLGAQELRGLAGAARGAAGREALDPDLLRLVETSGDTMRQAERLTSHLDPELPSFPGRPPERLPFEDQLPVRSEPRALNAAELAAPRGHGSRYEQELALGLRAHADDAEELLARPSLAIGEDAGPPPRIPLSALPDPAVLPRKEFTELAPLPEPVSAAVHREAVEQAVGAGERVRPAVLEDYPDLSAEVAPFGAAAEAGFVRIPTGPTFLQRFFTSGGQFSALGDLKGYAFARANLARAEEKAGERRVANVLRDFSSAFEDDVVRAGHNDPGQVLDYVTAGLSGENDLSGISPKLRAAAEAMRQHYDELSGGYLDRSDLSAALRETIEQNRGTYQHRSFAAFENPDWASIVDPTSRRHDPRERWRWDAYMDWARGERTKALAAPVYPGARVVVNDQPAIVLRQGITEKEAADLAAKNPLVSQAAVAHWDAWRQGQISYEQLQALRRAVLDPETAKVRAQHAGNVGVQFPDGTTAVVPRADLLPAGGMGTWTDDQLTAYGQRLLHRDPDALFAIGQGAVGREGRGNLKRRIRQDPTVDRLPSDLAARVNAGQLSLPGAIDQAKQRPGWWAEYLETAEGLPKELDDLLGLYRDPSERYRSGAMRAIHDQAVYKLHADLDEQGLGKIFFEEPRPGSYVQIGGKGPLSTRYASPEVAAVIRGTENTAKQAGALLNAWRKLNGFTKLGKTALNFPGGITRNLAAWVPQLMSGGHFVAAFNPARAVQLLKYQVADKLGTKRGNIARLAKRFADSIELADGTRLGERWSMDLDELRPEIDFLYRQGVFGESSHAADVRHYTGAFETLREPEAVHGLRKAIAAPVQAGTAFWAGGDDLGKHLYYRAELQNLLWADGKLGALQTLPADYFTREEFLPLAEEAARRVRLVTPTASMQAPVVNALRDVPVAPFPGWTSEVFRNAKEQIKLGLSDLRSSNPRMKVLGAKRLSGFAATAALSGGALAAGINHLSGAEEPEGLRSFVPPWSRDSQLAVLNVDKKTGKARFIDLSALMPQAAFMDAVGVALRSIDDPTDSSWDASLDATQSLLSPYIEEDIIANAVLDWARNKQGGESALMRPLNMLRQHERYDQGYPVYTEGADTTTQVKQSAYHFWRALGPSGVAGLQGERMARALFEDNPEVRKYFVELTNYDRDLDIRDEGLAAAGLRVSTTDVSKALKRMGTDYARQRTEAASLYTRRSRMGTDNRAHPEVTIKAKAEANAMAKQAHESMARVVADALRLGFSEYQIRDWMRGDGKGFGIAKKHVTALMNDARRLRRGEEVNFYIPVVD